MKKVYKLLLFVVMMLPLIADAQTITIGAGVNTSAVGSNAGPIYRSSAASGFDFSNHYFFCAFLCYPLKIMKESSKA